MIVRRYFHNLCSPLARYLSEPKILPLSTAGSRSHCPDCARISLPNVTFKRSHSSSTVDTSELERFGSLAHKWWDDSGEYVALRSLNKLRVPLVTRAVASSTSHSSQPSLTGCKILDVGCGGGLLSEPLARLGALVTGLDAAPENIAAANARKNSVDDPSLNSNLQYVCTTIEEFVEGKDNYFDAIVASEVVEHVNALPTFIQSCVQLTKPGGSLVFTTINRTQLSYLTAILLAEHVAGIVPVGTHDWEKFVSPDTLQSLLEQNNCHLKLLHGMYLNAITKNWSWIANTDVNYAAVFNKGS